MMYGWCTHGNGKAITSVIKEFAQRRGCSCASRLSPVKVIEQRVPFCFESFQGEDAPWAPNGRFGHTDGKSGEDKHPGGSRALHERHVISHNQVVQKQPKEPATANKIREPTAVRMTLWWWWWTASARPPKQRSFFCTCPRRVTRFGAIQRGTKRII